jgi:hypothetical protein
MNVFSKVPRVFSKLRHLSAKKVVMTAAVAVAVMTTGVTGISALSAKASAAPECNGNSIISCGAPSRAAFIKDVKASKQLQAVYATFGLKTQADYDRFISSAVPGTAVKSNNTIVVDGRVVASNVGSIGNWVAYQGSNPRPFNIAGKKYWGNLNTKAFAASTTSIPVDVLFDATGKMQFAVMTSTCANPVYGSVVQPTYACKNLNATAVSGQANTYNFNTSTAVSSGVQITKVVYNFGDGTPAVTEANPATFVKHTFTKAAKTTVSVYVKVPGGAIVVLVNCERSIPFTPPKPPTPPAAVFACTLLTATLGKVDQTTGNATYTLTATASAKNATIKSYSFDFGDGKTAPVVTGATTASTTHVYLPGTHTAKVSVTVLTNTGVTKTVSSPYCATPITVKTPECKPGVPVNSPECKPSSLTCVNLTFVPGAIDQTTGKQSFSFTATGTADNATITDYGFMFDDGVVTNTGSGASATTTHVYAPGAHTTTVIVAGKDAAGHTIQADANVKCTVTTTVKGPECKPGVPSNSPACFTYTCDLFKITQGDNRTVTISDFKASTTNPNATLNVVVDWGDGSTPLSAATVTGQTHSFAADQSYTITATAHFTIPGQTDDTTVSGPNCVQTVSFTATPVAPPTELPNTGAGNVIGIFGIVAVLGTLAHRLFMARRLNQQG